MHHSCQLTILPDGNQIAYFTFDAEPVKKRYSVANRKHLAVATTDGLSQRLACIKGGTAGLRPIVKVFRITKGRGSIDIGAALAPERRRLVAGKPGPALSLFQRAVFILITYYASPTFTAADEIALQAVVRGYSLAKCNLDFTTCPVISMEYVVLKDRGTDVSTFQFPAKS